VYKRQALYGSDAIGGVVQIFTKKPQRTNQDKQTSGSVDLGYGSNNTRRLGLSASTAGEQGGVRFGVGQELSDGMNARRDNSGDDAYRATGGSLSAWYALGPNTEASLSALATDINNEFDPNPQFNRDNQTVLNARLRHQGPQGQESTLRVGTATEELEFPLFNFGTRSFQDQLAVDHRQAALGGTVLLGYEYLNQNFKQTTSFPPPAGSPNISNTQSHSVLGNYTANWAQWRVELTARFDNNSNYQDVWTGQASASHPIGSQ
jgi:vitamin B12 transporter